MKPLRLAALSLALLTALSLTACDDSGKPQAVADLGSLSGDLDRLARGRKARVQLLVELSGDDKLGAVFDGTFIVLPAKPFGAYEEGGNEEE